MSAVGLAEPAGRPRSVPRRSRSAPAAICRCRAGEHPGAQAEGPQQRVDHAGRRWSGTLVPVMWIDRIAGLRGTRTGRSSAAMRSQVEGFGSPTQASAPASAASTAPRPLLGARSATARSPPDHLAITRGQPLCQGPRVGRRSRITLDASAPARAGTNLEKPTTASGALARKSALANFASVWRRPPAAATRQILAQPGPARRRRRSRRTGRAPRAPHRRRGSPSRPATTPPTTAAGR